jgi:hypothetical protein
MCAVLNSAGRKAGLPLAIQPHFPRLCSLHFLSPSHLVQYPLPRLLGLHRILRPGALPSDLLPPLSSPFARQRNLHRPVLVHLRLARRGLAPRAAHRGGRGTHQWNDNPRPTRSAVRRYQGQRLGEVQRQRRCRGVHLDPERRLEWERSPIALAGSIEGSRSELASVLEMRYMGIEMIHMQPRAHIWVFR